MKKSMRMLILALALVLVLGAGALYGVSTQRVSAETTLAEDAALATLDGAPITYAEVRTALQNMLNSSESYAEDETDYETALKYLVRNQVIEAKIKEWGLDQFTAEEEEAFLADAQKDWDYYVQQYVAHYLSEDTEEARAKLYEEGEAYYRSYGFSVESLADEYRRDASYDLLETRLLEGKDTSVSQEEIQALFDELVEEEKNMYAGSAAIYEMYKYYYGYDTWYIPTGYRGIIHILMTVDDSLLSAYETAQAAYEETVTEDAPDGDAALKAARDEALNAVLASKQTEIDDIYARLAQGESFQSLIAQYGEDTGMQDEATLAEGYAVHQDSIFYDHAFISAAFSDKMQQPGDISDPVVGGYGIHILYYLRDIPGGAVDLSEDIGQAIQQYLEAQKQNAIFEEALEAWTGEHEVVYNQEAIDAAKALAGQSGED